MGKRKKRAKLIRVALIFVGVLAIPLLAYVCLQSSVSKDLAEARRNLQEEGIALSPEDVIPPLVSDDENAALLYQKAFELFVYVKDGDEERAFRRMFRSGGRIEWSEEARELAVAMCERNADALDLVREAAEKKACRFPLDYAEGTDIELSHLGKMRNAARLLAAEALLQYDEGRIDEALRTCVIAMRTGRGLETEPFLISQLARIDSCLVALSAVRVILEQEMPGEEVCGMLLEEFAAAEGRQAYARSAEGQLVLFGAFAFDGLAEGSTTYSPTGQDDDSIRVRLYTNPLGRLVLQRDRAFYYGMMRKFITSARVPYFEARETLREIDETVEDWPKYMLISTMILTGPSKPHSRQALLEAVLREGRLALGLKLYKSRNGAYPETLAELRPDILKTTLSDPFTGGDFVYRRKGEGFILYSLGENGQDDGGIFYVKGSRLQYTDIAWRCER